MGVSVLILLAVVWAVVLVPPYLRHRGEARPGSSVTSFRQGLDVLGRSAPPSVASGAHFTPVRGSAPLGPGAPRGRAAVRKRRRDVLLTLAGVAGFTFLLAVAFGGTAILLNLVADAALVGYVYLLVQLRKLAAEQAQKVRYLPAPAPSQPRLVTVRRSASG
ncbi:hypothetical protein PO878_15685 [Iamia majanohamensis]|uniref:Uncharacterized protein n=1 Tax=Iamia majanohamensis TaxID=467976 RepID=A0AAE9Y7N6_9ACTN|nr:hypothetical protein [Iamia majanohamensis]WCO65943.1 hypothetical protein PO878_15685 [Iamia majanohamensis]